jgi:hypothetical protein
MKLIKERHDARKIWIVSRLSHHKLTYARIKAIIQRKCWRMEHVIWEEVADNIQGLDNSSNSRAHFQSIKVIYGDQSTEQIRKTVVKSDGVNVTVSEEEYISKWLEYFTALLNQPTKISDSLHEYSPKQCIVREDLARPFTEEQDCKAFTCMKNGKAPGNSGLPAELFNYSESDFLIPTVTKPFNYSLDTGNCAKSWRDAIVSIQHKKGSVLLCDNYRSQSLLNQDGKALVLVILNILTPFSQGLR